jgi:hypothetical protein
MSAIATGLRRCGFKDTIGECCLKVWFCGGRACKAREAHIGGLAAMLFFVCIAATAQTLLPTPLTKYDGTYAFVSTSNVNEWNGPVHVRRCGPMGKSTPLVIIDAHAEYTTHSGYLVEGTVGPRGELSMRYPPEPEGKHGGITPGLERPVYGQIDSNGTVRARQIGNRCSHDMIWPKQPK